MTTVIGLFGSSSVALEAAHQLIENGFQPDNISFVMNDAGDGYTHFNQGSLSPGIDAVSSVTEVLTNVCSRLIPGIGLVVSAGLLLCESNGVQAHLLTALRDRGVPDDRAGAYAEGVRRGAYLLVVDVEVVHAVLAAQVVNLHSPIDLDRRVAAWRARGWKRFDSHAVPLSVDDLRIERDQARGYRDRVGGFDA